MPRTFDNDEIRRLADIRSALSSVGDSLSLPQLVTLLTVALEPGLSVNDLADRIGAPQQSASRYASVLLGRYQSTLASEPKEPLIAQEVNAEDPRKRALFLTDKGRELIAGMIQFESSPINKQGA